MVSGEIPELGVVVSRHLLAANARKLEIKPRPADDPMNAGLSIALNFSVIIQCNCYWSLSMVFGPFQAQDDVANSILAVCEVFVRVSESFHHSAYNMKGISQHFDALIHGFQAA